MPTRTVVRTGEPPQQEYRPLFQTTPLEYRESRSGRVLVRPGDAQRSYQVGGQRKAFVRTADIVGPDGRIVTVTNPAPGDEIVNGLSDKIDSPRRVQRRGKSKSGGKKGAANVLR